MTAPPDPMDDSSDHADDKNVGLNRALLREFLRERVGFQFAIAVIDDDGARRDTVAELGRELAEEGIEWVVIDLRALPEDVVLLSEIRRRLEALGNRPAAVGVLGLEWHLDIPSGGIRDVTTTLLANANFQRDAFPALCPAPLLLWATSLSLPALPRLAPDLWHWRAATFDLCVDPPDTPWVDRLERMVPRPDEVWQAQPREELQRRVTLLRQVLDEIGPDGSLRRARLLVELAGVTELAGEYGIALQAAQEALEIATKEKDKRLRAVSLGCVARLKADQGFMDEALSLNEERLAIYGDIGDARSRAVALGDVARLKADRGFVDEALSLHKERLAIYRELDDVRSRAVSLNDIARLKANRGFVDEALSLHEETLAIFDELGDVRSRAATLGDIAHLKADRGFVDEALSLLEEMLAIFGELGDVRSRAVTLGDIARLKANRGFVDEALTLYQQKLAITERLGDLEGQANCWWSMAMLRLRKADVGEDEVNTAFEDLIFAYQTVKSIGHAGGIAAVGFDLARISARFGDYGKAREIGEESLVLFTQLHIPKMPEAVRKFLDSLPPSDAEASAP
jgi:tetratricopeptide (TPR) repeat protein